jgi:hypothetical protein
MQPFATQHVPLIDDAPRVLVMLDRLEASRRDGPPETVAPNLRLAATALAALLEPMRTGTAPGVVFEGVRPALALRIIDAAADLGDLVGRPDDAALAEVVAAARGALTAALDEAAAAEAEAASAEAEVEADAAAVGDGAAEGVTVDLTADPTVDLTGALDRAGQLARRGAHDGSASVTELCHWIGALLGADDPAALAPLLGVSARTLRRWTDGAARPRDGNAERLRTVARAAGHLRRRLDAPGARAWFDAPSSDLGGRTPLAALDDGDAHGALVAAASRVVGASAPA